MKKLYILFFLTVSAYGDIKITFDELEFLIRIGILDKFQFIAQSNTGFSGKQVYEDDGTTFDYGGSGWGVSYLVDSFKTKVKLQQLIHSDQVIMDTAEYNHCSCYGPSDTASWESGEPINELNIIKYLSDIDPVLKNEKTDLERSKAEFFRDTFIHNLRRSSSNIYISDENKNLLEVIRSVETTSLSVMEARDLLSYAPLKIRSIEQQLPHLKERFEE